MKKGEKPKMKWFIASDIHGSACFCEHMLNAYRKEHADRMLLLGDLLYHGPRNDLPEGYAPKSVIGLLSGYQKDILCVRGNCEAEVDQMVLPFPVLADYALLNLEDHMIFATHGHVYNAQHLPPLHLGDLLVHGHTHVPECSLHEGIRILNPGSVSIPKNGSWHGYMIWEGRTFVWKDLDGREQMRWVCDD